MLPHFGVVYQRYNDQYGHDYFSSTKPIWYKYILFVYPVVLLQKVLPVLVLRIVTSVIKGSCQIYEKTKLLQRLLDSGRKLY